MKKLIRLLIPSILLLVILVLPLKSFAEQNFENGNSVILSKGEVVKSDYFASGGSVVLNGTVYGDSYVAGGNVSINGTVFGDVLVAGGNVTIGGKVTGNVRAAGGQILIIGSVDKNVTAAGGSVSIQTPAVIGGSVTSVGGNLSLFAPVSKGAVLAGGQVSINSAIGSDVRVSSEQLDVMQDATINGRLYYWSPNQAHIVPFTIKDNVSYFKTELKPSREQYRTTYNTSVAQFMAGVGLFWVIATFSASLLTGLLLLHFLPTVMDDIRTTLTLHPWKSMAIGLVTLALLPLVIIILLVSVIGIPFAILFAALFFLLILCNQIFIAYAIGQKLIPQKKGFSLFVGLVVYSVISFLPFIGWIFNCLALFVGLGAFATVQFRLYTTLRSKKLI